MNLDGNATFLLFCADDDVTVHEKKFTYTYALLLSKLQVINELMQHAYEK